MNHALTLQAQLGASAEKLYASGYAALTEGDAKTAQRHFGLMLSVAPFDQRPWLGLASSRERLGDYAVAAGLYQLAAAVSPDPLLCLLGQARSHFKLGNHCRAHGLLDEAETLTEQPSMLALIERMRSTQ